MYLTSLDNLSGSRDKKTKTLVSIKYRMNHQFVQYFNTACVLMYLSISGQSGNGRLRTGAAGSCAAVDGGGLQAVLPACVAGLVSGGVFVLVCMVLLGWRGWKNKTIKYQNRGLASTGKRGLKKMRTGTKPARCEPPARFAMKAKRRGMEKFLL